MIWSDLMMLTDDDNDNANDNNYNDNDDNDNDNGDNDDNNDDNRCHPNLFYFLISLRAAERRAAASVR